MDCFLYFSQYLHNLNHFDEFTLPSSMNNKALCFSIMILIQKRLRGSFGRVILIKVFEKENNILTLICFQFPVMMK